MGIDQNLVQKKFAKKIDKFKMKIYCNYYRQKGHWQRKHEKKRKIEKSNNETNVMECSIFITNTDQSFSSTFLLMMKSMK